MANSQSASLLFAFIVSAISSHGTFVGWILSSLDQGQTVANAVLHLVTPLVHSSHNVRFDRLTWPEMNVLSLETCLKTRTIQLLPYSKSVDPKVYIPRTLSTFGLSCINSKCILYCACSITLKTRINQRSSHARRRTRGAARRIKVYSLLSTDPNNTSHWCVT
jgi:hypothetical protein